MNPGFLLVTNTSAGGAKINETPEIFFASGGGIWNEKKP
ncbi:MAG: hypothetical protein ACI92Z_002657 [Paracoccaceae bacterium]|jgi:hypothetical protein